MTIGYSPSPRTMRRAMRDQQVHVRSHGLSTPLMVGSQVVQWHENKYVSYFYRPADAMVEKWALRAAIRLVFIMAQEARRLGSYNTARQMHVWIKSFKERAK